MFNISTAPRHFLVVFFFFWLDDNGTDQPLGGMYKFNPALPFIPTLTPFYLFHLFA